MASRAVAIARAKKAQGMADSAAESNRRARSIRNRLNTGPPSEYASDYDQEPWHHALSGLPTSHTAERRKHPLKGVPVSGGAVVVPGVPDMEGVEVKAERKPRKPFYYADFLARRPK